MHVIALAIAQQKLAMRALTLKPEALVKGVARLLKSNTVSSML